MSGNFLGLDIGSRGAKGVLLSNGTIYTVLRPTGFNMQETGDALLEELLQKSGLSRSDITYAVGTGYGRITLEFQNIPYSDVTEISCHAKGAHYLHPAVKTIVDIGGQDSKAIRVDPENGKVVDFVLNDKCAAGTGKFLEMIASSLSLKIEELGEVSLLAKRPVRVTSQCVVFAESEVISLKAQGETQADIAAGIHLAIARRVGNLLSRVGIQSDVVFTGGVSKNRGLRKALEEYSKAKFVDLSLDAQYAGALGAAVYAKEFAQSELNKTGQSYKENEIFANLEQDLEAAKEQLVHSSDKKKAGYFCVYTPIELITAAGAEPVRLFKGGDSVTVNSGEIYTQSYFCQFAQYSVGAYREGDELYKSIDRIYTYTTCDQMKKATEAIGEFFDVPTKIFSLPREGKRDVSRSFMRGEVEAYQTDLEELTGNKITNEDLKKQISAYNEGRRWLKKLSELRKQENPPITGGEFLSLVKAFYYLPLEKSLKIYENIYNRLSSIKSIGGNRPLRLLFAGGIVADGDRRLIDLIEKDLGARIVVEDHCTGLRPFYHEISEEQEPLSALADGYLDQAPCARMKPLDERLDFSKKLALEYEVDAAVYVSLKFCSCYGISKNSFFKRFQQLGIPVLDISGDYSESDLGQLRTRIEAFFELFKKGDSHELESVGFSQK